MAQTKPQINIVPVTGEKDNQFVGIKVIDNQIEFHYPETYELSSTTDGKKLRLDILAVLRTISLAKSKTSDFSSYNSEYKSAHSFPLSSYLWIINDYLTYGRYENKEKKYVQGVQGRINWKKTLHNSPVISNGNIIYTKIISEKKDQKDNVITEIYNCCVKKAIEGIGWIYGISYDSKGIDYDKLLEKNYKYYLSEVITELTHTFEDTKKARLQNMKNILTGLDEKNINAKELIYGVDSYDYVYERMIDSMFSNVSEISDFYPNGTIDLVLEPKAKNSSNLRPDTVVVNNKDKKAYIIDAKNYRYGVTFDPNDVPETTSIQKQVTYGEYIKQMQNTKEPKQTKYKEIYSAFVMPYSMNNNKHKERFNSTIEFVGISTTKWYMEDGYMNRRIANILIDMKFLIEHWVEKNNPDNINCLIPLIEENIKKGVVRE